MHRGDAAPHVLVERDVVGEHEADRVDLDCRRVVRAGHVERAVVDEEADLGQAERRVLLGVEQERVPADVDLRRWLEADAGELLEEQQEAQRGVHDLLGLGQLDVLVVLHDPSDQPRPGLVVETFPVVEVEVRRQLQRHGQLHLCCCILCDGHEPSSFDNKTYILHFYCKIVNNKFS